MHLIFTNDLIKKGPKILGPFFIFFLLGLFENILFRSDRSSEVSESLGIVYFQIYFIDRNSKGLSNCTSCGNRFAWTNKV
jgi:hypothetical protein